MNLFNLPHIPFWIQILAAFVIVAGYFFLLSQVSQKKGYQYTRKASFMTRSEREFYEMLLAAVGNEMHVFAQVHLPTILDHKVNGQKWGGAFRHISQKSVDFVLCDKKDIAPLLAIELDDRSHERSDRIERDREVERMLSEAGMPLLRVPDYKSLTSASLAERIRETIALV